MPAILDTLCALQAQGFAWPKGNAWIQILGDRRSQPKALSFVRALQWPCEERTEKLAELLPRMAALPFFGVLFDESAAALEGVYLSDSPFRQGPYVSLEELRTHIRGLGLRVSTIPVSKGINKSVASIYQTWQRAALGGLIRITDLDLIRTDERGVPIEILELKRSTYDLGVWRPFTQDFANFDLIRNAFPSMPLTIAYNQMYEGFEDPTLLKLFSYFDGKPELLNYCMLDEFISGAYLKTRAIPT